MEVHMKPVRVYTTRICAYCHAAKRLLSKKDIPYQDIDVSMDHETRRWLVEQSGQRTVPQIFIGDDAIGGFTELRALDRSGRLDAMLAVD